jgi:hypothetical protein
MVHKMINEVMKVPDVVNDLSVQLEFCGSDISMNRCVDVLQEDLDDLEALPERIDNAVQRADGIIDGLESVLNKCVETKVAQMLVDGFEIMTDIASCYVDKKD